MKKFLSIFALFLAYSYMAMADTTTTQPKTVIFKIEALGGNGTVTVTGAGVVGTPTVSGNFTIATCNIEEGTTVSGDISLKATAKDGYIFKDWAGSDTTFPDSRIPTDTTNPYDILIEASSGFIKASATAWLDTVRIKAGFRDKAVCNTLWGSISTDNGYYETTVEGPGSTFTIDTTTTTLIATYDQQKLGTGTDPVWPWHIATFYFNEDTVRLSSKITAVRVKYEADHLMRMTFPFDTVNLDPLGENHGFTFDPTTAPTEIIVYVDQLEVPSWAKHRNIALKLDFVKTVGFAMDEDAEAGAYKGKFSIYSVEFCNGTSTGINEQKINKLNDITINGLWNNSINITTNKTGNYNVAVYAIDGKAIYSTNTTLNQGNNLIKLNQRIDNGVYMIYVSNDKGVQVKKIGMIK